MTTWLTDCPLPHSRSGMFTYLSYRDPNLMKTVDVYDGTPQFLRELELDQVGRPHREPTQRAARLSNMVTDGAERRR